jgi:RNA polymerase sigma-70 factor, ECF subfamily
MADLKSACAYPVTFLPPGGLYSRGTRPESLHLRRPDKAAAERMAVEAAKRDPSRFAELYEGNFERVYAFVARRTRSREEAEDITAAVFHKALANLPRFQWRGVPFAAWLLKIAANAMNDHSKRLKREREIAPADEPAQMDLRDLEDRARLFRLVGRLPAGQRSVIVMRFAEQSSMREIARRLGRSEGAVKQLQLRALKSLRAMMDKTDD